MVLYCEREFVLCCEAGVSEQHLDYAEPEMKVGTCRSNIYFPVYSIVLNMRLLRNYNIYWVELQVFRLGEMIFNLIVKQHFHILEFIFEVGSTVGDSELEFVVDTIKVSICQDYHKVMHSQLLPLVWVDGQGFLVDFDEGKGSEWDHFYLNIVAFVVLVLGYLIIIRIIEFDCRVLRYLVDKVGSCIKYVDIEIDLV